ncbi:MAG: hypothetical protein IJX53_00525 [Clostridia bacterium]|nr:hypothetical protein [Clostridia bacterium]
MGDMLFVVLGISGGTLLLCGAWGLRCLVMGLLGYEELPKLRRKRKIPRKAATKRGIVGQRVRRSACEYSKIIIDYGTNVKSKPQVFVDWRYMRG